MMRAFLFAVLLAGTAAAQTNLPTILVVGTRTVEVRRITRVEPDGVTVMHSAGLTKFFFTELPKEWRDRYNYDPTRAVAYARSAQTARQSFAAQQQEALRRGQAQRATEAAAALLKIRITGRVLQALANGDVLLTDVYQLAEVKEQDKRVLGFVATTNRLVPVALAERAFVTGFSGYADGDTFLEDVFDAGTHSYTTVAGADSTIRKFSSSLGALSTPRASAPPPRAAPSPGTDLRAFGSGFLISTNGFILTNHHVVKDALRVKVRAVNGTHFARIVDRDPDGDLALLKIDGVFAAAAFAPEATARLGQTVFTAGFPMPELQGFSPKITKGVISSMNGIHDDVRNYQIDAAIQPGNSGGPLADENGNILGVVVATINSEALAERTGIVAQNINYAVKKSYAERLLKAHPDVPTLSPPPSATQRPSFEDAVEKIRKATVLVIVY